LQDAARCKADSANPHNCDAHAAYHSDTQAHTLAPSPTLSTPKNSILNMLEAINLSKSYNGTPALKNLNLRVSPGEIFCLLGQNGAGKTTTINLFLGFIEPTSGEAKVDSLSVKAQPLETKKRLAYIPETVMLYLQNPPKFIGACWSKNSTWTWRTTPKQAIGNTRWEKICGKKFLTFNTNCLMQGGRYRMSRKALS